jgi:uncharacterized protein DUF1844
MSESKFTVVDRRKFKAEEEEREAAQPAAHEPEPPKASTAPAAGPRLVESAAPAQPETKGASSVGSESDEDLLAELPAPTAEESSEQKTAYDASARRMEDLVRAQNPAMGAPEPINFENLVQQLYVSAMVQMGAGTPQGQTARVDVIGARQTIDLLGVLAEKTRGNLTDAEDRMLQTVLYEARMAFLEVTRMITLQGVPAPPPKAKK